MDRQRRRGRRQFNNDVRTTADEALRTGMSPQELLRKLNDDFDEADVPALRTLQDWAQRYQPVDPSEYWSLRDTDSGAHARPVLDALGELIERAEGRPVGITRVEADYLMRVSRAQSDIPPWIGYTFARHYVRRAEAGLPATDIDAFLAIRPWANEAAFARLQWMWDAGTSNFTPPSSERIEGGDRRASFAADIYQALVELLGPADYTGGSDAEA